MNRIWVVVGALAVLVGLVFFFQGIGALKGSSMTGESFWMWVGVILVVAGGLALYRGARSGRRRSSS
jgi:protein-S-isoprenylcysteine O-methyltransferase Ste14